MLNVLRRQFLEWGLGKDLGEDLAALVALALVAFVALLAHRLARGPLLRGLAAIIRRTDIPWDDALIEYRVLHRLVHLVPGLIFYHLGPLALDGHPVSVNIIQTAAHIYLVLSGLLAIEALISAGVRIYNGTSTSHEVSIKGLVQFSQDHPLFARQRPRRLNPNRPIAALLTRRPDGDDRGFAFSLPRLDPRVSRWHPDLGKSHGRLWRLD